MEIDDLPDKKKKKRTLHGKVGNIVVLSYSEIVIQLSSTAILVSSDSAVATEVDPCAVAPPFFAPGNWISAPVAWLYKCNVQRR